MKIKGSEIHTPKIEIHTIYFIILIVILDLIGGVDFNFLGVDK